MATTIERLLVEMRTVIVGQQRPLERMLVCMLARGHCLLESVPGLAKTLAIETLAKTVGGTFARIQFTPDLLPSDIIGTRIYRGSSERFDVELGPVFVNFLLADEINRAPAKVQSALLEVMAEQQVSIGGTTYPVPRPFVVMATQNPIESDGVYQLPDAQRDRFLMKVTLGYPDHAEEISIVERMGVSEPEPRQIIDLDQLVELQRKCDEVLVDRSVLRYAVDLVHATRDPEAHQLADLAPLLAIGASPRATLGLIRAAKALAAMRGRSYASPQDVFEVAPEILRHRLVLTYDALAREVSVEHVLQRLMATVPAAWVHPGRRSPSPIPASPTDGSALVRRRLRSPRRGRGPPTPTWRRSCARSSCASTASSTGSCTASTKGSRRDTGASTARAGRTSSATTSGGSTGTSRRARRNCTCAT